MALLHNYSVLTPFLLLAYSLPTSCLIHAYFMPTPCLIHAYFMPTPCLLLAYSMPTPCLLQAYFTPAPAAVAEQLERGARVCALCMRLNCHEFESRPGISERRFRILVGNNSPLKSSRCYGTPNRHQPNIYARRLVS